jgi:hypothetical protein
VAHVVFLKYTKSKGEAWKWSVVHSFIPFFFFFSFFHIEQEMFGPWLDSPHTNASKMKQAVRTSQASRPPSAGGKEK